MKECANRKRNLEKCSCTSSCTRRGMCCECIAHHRESGEVPGCLFSKESEKSYDRSIHNFIASRKPG